jgi:hypothetical protein
MVGKVLKDFQDFCNKQFEGADCEGCVGCKYYPTTSSEECLKEYLKDQCK